MPTPRRLLGRPSPQQTASRIDTPPVAHSRSMVALACALGTVAVAVAVVAPATPTEAAVAELTEVHQFEPAGGQAAGYASHIAGDYVIYTSQRGAAVDVGHRTGPGPNDWELTTLDAPVAGVDFGRSVRFDDEADRAFVSAPGNASVYVYTRSGTNTWTPSSTLAPGPYPHRVTSYTGFGESLDVQGERLVVGVPNATVDGKSNAGFAYAVDLVSQAWTALIPTTPIALSITGQSVALDGDDLAVAAVQNTQAQGYRVGGVYLWDLGDPAAQPLFTTQPEDDPRVCLSKQGRGPAFGMSLAWAGGVLYVGSPIEIDYTGDDPSSQVDGCTLEAVAAGNTTQGAVYRFDTGLNQIGPKLVPPPGSLDFGYSIAARNGALLASSDHAPGFQGEVYVYDTADLTAGPGDENDREQTPPVQTLVASNGADNARFGTQLYGQGMSLWGSRALIAAPAARNGAGAVYLFEPIADAAAVEFTVADASIVHGQQARLTATFSDSAATGWVTFTVGGVALSAVPVENGEAGVVLAAASHAAGTYPVSAEFSVDGDSVSASAEATLTIRKATTSATLSARPTYVAPGGRATLAGAVRAQYGTTPTGSVAIVVDGVRVGHAQLDPTGAFRWTLTASSPGAFSVQAEYLGDANDLASAAARAVVTVVGPREPRGGERTAIGPPAAGNPGRLSATGADVLPMTLAAVAFVAAGAGAVALSRRRVG